MIPIYLAHLPIAIQIVFDDVGWWSGSDDSAAGGPFRTQMPRAHCLKDYQAITRLGQLTGTRPQCAFVIGEWDVDNILREVPGATPHGKSWDNPWKNHPDIPAAAALLRENNHKTLEIGFHAILHEFWGPSGMERTQWHGPQGEPRPATWASHIAAWKAIWARHNFGPIDPISYVPCAGRHRFGSGFAKHLYNLGVRWINEPFMVMRQDKPLQHHHFGIEDGLYIIERMEDFAPWNALAHPPGEGRRHPYLGGHWTNLLHENPDKNNQVVDAWVEALKWYQNDTHTFLGTSTQQAGSQFIYHTLLNAYPEKNTIELDFTQLDKHALPFLDDTFLIRVTMENKPVAVAPSSAGEFKLLKVTSRPHMAYDITLQRLTRQSKNSLAFI